MPDRTTTGPYDVRTLKLCRDDRRKLYGLLDADVPRQLSKMEGRLGRQDKLLAVLSFTNGLLLWKVLGSPTPPLTEAAGAMIRLFFG